MYIFIWQCDRMLCGINIYMPFVVYTQKPKNTKIHFLMYVISDFVCAAGKTKISLVLANNDQQSVYASLYYINVEVSTYSPI